jgi:N-terminal half of MaoC dehydratase
MAEPGRPKPAPAEPFEIRVEYGKVIEFARATGARHPEHLSGDLVVSPPTFLQVAALWQTQASSALPPDRDPHTLIHAEQEFEFPEGPPLSGTTLTGHCSVDDEWTKVGRRGGRLDFIRLVTDYTDADGRLAARVRSTYVVPEKPTGRAE